MHRVSGFARGKFIGRHAASDDDKTRRMQISDLFLSAEYLLSAHKSSANLSLRSLAGVHRSDFQGRVAASRIDTFYVSQSRAICCERIAEENEVLEVLKSCSSITVIFRGGCSEIVFC